MPQGYGAADPFAAQNNGGGQGYNPYAQQQHQQQFQAPQRDNTVAYQPPVRQPAPASSVPFIRKEDPSAPAPAKAPTMSLKIGGSSSSGAPANVSLKIGGNKAPAAKTPAPATASSKTATPNTSKPGTPGPEDKSKAAPGAKTAARKEEAAAKEQATAKKVEERKEQAAAAIAKNDTKTADALLAEVKAHVDEETIADLYGQEDDRKSVVTSFRGASSHACTLPVKDLKPHVNIVFIGHVDAGKSTMGGNILYLTGMVDKRTLEKYEREAKEAGRESWYLSWALDSTSQEREKVGEHRFEARGNRLYLQSRLRVDREKLSKSVAPTSRPLIDATPFSMHPVTRHTFRR